MNPTREATHYTLKFVERLGVGGLGVAEFFTGLMTGKIDIRRAKFRPGAPSAGFAIKAFTLRVKICYTRCVNIGFKDAKLQRTFIEGKDYARLGRDIFQAFLQKVQLLADAESEADLYSIKSLHFEKLFGDRKGQRSVRLNKRFRLVFEIRKAHDGSLVWIIEVVDYH